MTTLTTSENVTVLTKDDKTYYILGTAHISAKSVDEVNQLIEEVQPDTVCVELCPTRHASLTSEHHWRNLDLFQVIKQGKALMLLANMGLSSFQLKMGEQMGVKPGAELLAGVKKAEEVGAELVLADREIQITLKRTWGNLSLWRKAMVMAGLMDAVISKEEVTEAELEKMKEKDQISALTEEFAKAMPQVKRPLIDERDQYLMSKIEEAPGKKIVAVVGAGHVNGMKQYFGQPVDRAAIEELPKPGKLLSIIKWGFPLLIVAFLVRGYFEKQGESFYDLLNAWVLPNFIGAGLCCLLVGSRLLTAIATAFAAPLTSLTPVVGAGMVSGLMEAWLRKPKVEDFENLPKDIQSWRGFFRNDVTRVLLVFVAGSLGSAVGTVIGVSWLAKLLMQA